MAQYELMYILKPDLDEEHLQGTVDTITNQVTQAGGTVANVDKWGRRRLAYPISKHEEGFYVVVTFSGTGAIANEITRLLNISEDVIRSIVVRQDED